MNSTRHGVATKQKAAPIWVRPFAFRCHSLTRAARQLYCSAISTSTPAGRSRRIRASTVLSVGSTMSIDRKSVVSGKSVSVRVDLGGRRIIKKKKQTTLRTTRQVHIRTQTRRTSYQQIHKQA